jgi:quercetin dioxygenase-like cupin family protein
VAGLNRRDMLVGGVAAAVGGIAAAQTGVAATGVVANKAAGDFVGGAKVFEVSAMPRTKTSNGSDWISAFRGTMPTGEFVSMHESWLPPGMAPVPLHVVHHNEVVAMLEGEVDFFHGEEMHKAKAGDVIYVATGTNHAMRNVGTVTARYMVFQIGGDTK